MASGGERRGPVSVLRGLLGSEAAGGTVLIVAATAAMLAANGGASAAYFDLLRARVGPLLVHQWVNDALMSVFFLLVGLEIKREFLDGRLSTWADRRLPLLAALAGMVAPAIAYLLITGGAPGLKRGWALPAATDIAFALGVLALLGPRAPVSLKLLLLAIAIVDDLGAVLIIALFYTAKLNIVALVLAGIVLVLMVALRFRRVERLAPYLALAVALWLAVFLSGVHATVAGVLAAFMVPIRRSPGAPDAPSSPLHRLEHALQPWVAFLVVPLFGFVNAGVALGGVGWPDLLAPVTLGVAAGLFLGKQVGILAGVGLAVATGLAGRPQGASWLQTYGVALLCGIGFTMSLFIGELAFDDPGRLTEVKLGVLAGSIASALAGFLLLRFAAPTIAAEVRL